VQQLLEEAESDVLLLFDSCHSSHPAINVAGQGVTEVIAACGFETQAPAVGPHSFTNALIGELEECFSGPPISVAELHGRVISSLKKWKPSLLRDGNGHVWTDENGRARYECHKRRTPVHCFLTNESPYRSIMLTPLILKLPHPTVAGIDRPHSQSSTIPSGETLHSPESSEYNSSTLATTVSDISKPDHSLQVLLAIRLEDDYFIDDDEDDGKKLRTWCDWLKNIPEGAENITIQGVYKSCSALVILSLPIALWDLIPNEAAYSFIGFVNSNNLANAMDKPNLGPKTVLSYRRTDRPDRAHPPPSNSGKTFSTTSNPKSSKSYSNIDPYYYSSNSGQNRGWNPGREAQGYSGTKSSSSWGECGVM
jgi:hypothetical protein